MKKTIKSGLLLQILCAGICLAQITNIYDIRAFGAVGDGATQKDLGVFTGKFATSVASHGAALVRLFPNP